MANFEEKDINASIMEGEDSILDDVNAINNLIESEKAKQKAETSTGSTKVATPRKVNSVPKKVTSTVVVDTTPNLEMERLHLRIVNDTIDILYRPNHCYVSFVPNDENGKAEVKRVALMSRDEFIEYLKKSTCFRFSSKSDIESITRNSSDENWYKGAWSMNTKKLLEELGVENPVEEVISSSR